MTHEQFRDAKGQAFLEDLDNYAVKLLGFSYMRPHSMRNNNQILHGDQTRCEENSIGSTSVILVNYNYITVTKKNKNNYNYNNN